MRSLTYITLTGIYWSLSGELISIARCARATQTLCEELFFSLLLAGLTPRSRTARWFARSPLSRRAVRLCVCLSLSLVPADLVYFWPPLVGRADSSSAPPPPAAATAAASDHAVPRLPECQGREGRAERQQRRAVRERSDARDESGRRLALRREASLAAGERVAGDHRQSSTAMQPTERSDWHSSTDKLNSREREREGRRSEVNWPARSRTDPKATDAPAAHDGRAQPE